MSQKFKSLKSQVQNKKQNGLILQSNEKTCKKTVLNNKIPKDLIIYSNNQNIKKNPVPVKLNRIQSEYIKPISSQSLPKTPKISKINSNKINVDVHKQKRQTQRKYSFHKDELLNSSELKRKIKISQKHQKQISLNRPFEDFVKKSMKTSHISSKSLTREHSLKVNQNLHSLNIKQRIILKDNHNQPLSAHMKKVSKNDFQPIRVSSKIKSPSMKKISSTCSMKKYFILNKNKNTDKKAAKQIPLTTLRGFTNPQDNQSCLDHRSSYGNTLKIYNSSTDLNNTTNSSEKERQIFERVQRTLEYYRTNLDEQIWKRKTLQIQNSILKQELIKAKKVTK